MRARAIVCALWFDLVPWPVYERVPHFPVRGLRGYLAHAALNLRLAWRWATWREREDDREFEARVNAAPAWTRWHAGAR